MNITVMLSSGDLDEWADAADFMVEEGQLMVLAPIEGEEIPEGIKVVGRVEMIDQGPDLPPMEKTTTFALAALYAPGMWMKVELT